jgi:hypothetical protein
LGGHGNRDADALPLGFARGDMEGDDKWCALHDGTIEAWGMWGGRGWMHDGTIEA